MLDVCFIPFLLRNLRISTTVTMEIGPSLIFCYLLAYIQSLCDVEAKTINVSIMKSNVNICIVKNQIIIRMNRSNGDHHVLKIGKQMRLVGEPSWRSSYSKFQAVWENGAQLKIYLVSNQLYVRRFVVQWKLLYGVNDSLVECIDMSPYHWYGGGELLSQPWPIQAQPFPTTPYVPGHNTGGIVEPYFLSSAGVSYYVHSLVPLFVSIEGGTNRALCFRAEFRPPYRNTDLRPLTLEYTVSYSDPADMKILWLEDSAYQFGHPLSTPSFALVRNPVWSTWTYYKTFINQNTVLDFAEQIHRSHFPGGQIEIDSRWEGCHGEGTFNPTTFPDPANMIRRIRELGFEVTLWVHPFVNTDCRRVYKEGDREKYFVTVDGYSVTGQTTWSKGNSSAVIDVTNEAACDWWANRLHTLKDLGVTAFRFDTGDSSFLPHNAFLQVVEAQQPGHYFSAFAFFAGLFGTQAQSKIGYFSQHVGGTFLSFLNRRSDWSSDYGLRSVIPSVLHSGIVGYPFIYPESIAGDSDGNWPDRELYIRWTQLNAFLPVMSFSIPPWNYDDEVVRISRKMVELHANISDVIINAMLEVTDNGSPVIRPLWWMDSNDDIALTITDEFLVGLTYLVAPIVSQGAISRDIYIIRGTWTDMLRGDDIIGPKWLYNYNINLDEIAYFRSKY